MVNTNTAGRERSSIEKTLHSAGLDPQFNGEMHKLLIIDDDVELCGLIQGNLREDGFEVDAAHDPAIGMRFLESGQYALLILDVMLPGVSGFEVLRRLRNSSSEIPVVLLTARGDEIDRIVGLEIGADDYIPKPFHPRELAARIKAVLRRASAVPSGARADDRIKVGHVELDRGARSVRIGERGLDLSCVEFDVLAFLMSNAGRIVSRDQIASAVLGRELGALDRSIDMHISKIRQKLEDRANPSLIKTIRHAGYIFTKAY